MGELKSIDGGARDWSGEPFTKRLLELYRRVAYMEKGGTNKHFKYKFLQESQVKDRVNQACRDLGIVLVELELQLITPTRLGAGGKPEEAPSMQPLTQECVCLATLTLADAGAQAGNTGLSAVKLQGLGGGTDSGDKAPMKACVAAVKYALMNGLLIATGDEAEDSRADDDRAGLLMDRLNDCPSIERLQLLKAEVATFKGGVAYDALKHAYKEAAARLTPVGGVS